MKVLVVDDDKDVTTIAQRIIEKENHQVLTAKDGEMGYSAYLQFKPDLVLTDIEMPKKNGFELMAKIRSHNPSIMTIYMSGNPGRFISLLKKEQDRHQADFICKPFSMAKLAMALSELAH
jgi:DNA-binding response OmpR family regulator